MNPDTMRWARYRLNATILVKHEHPEAKLREIVTTLNDTGIFDPIEVADLQKSPYWLHRDADSTAPSHFTFSGNPDPEKPLSDLAFTVALGVWLAKTERDIEPFADGATTVSGLFQSICEAYRQSGITATLETASRWLATTTKEERIETQTEMVRFIKALRLGILLGVNRLDLSRVPTPILLASALCFEASDLPKPHNKQKEAAQ